MTATETPDTITVELPIEVTPGGYVKVEQVALASRERWREIAADPASADLSPLTARIAPAVVAWIERDEWEPLPIPEVGRTIKVTLGDGLVETFEVGETKDTSEWTHVWKAHSSSGARYIRRVRDVVDAGPGDIISWEYVDEWEPLDLPAEGRTIKATLRDGSVETFEVRKVFDDPAWAWVWKDDSGDAARFIERTPDKDTHGPDDIIDWEYVDEPAVDLAALVDKIAAAVNELSEAVMTAPTLAESDARIAATERKA